jgi:hypothetical protein
LPPRGQAATLTRAGVEFAEVAFDQDPDGVRSIGGAAVPQLVARDATGAEVGRIAGRIRGRPLARLLAR